MNNWKCNSRLHWQQEQCMFPKQYTVEACQSITDSSISPAVWCYEHISQEDNVQQAAHITFFFFFLALLCSLQQSLFYLAAAEAAVLLYFTAPSHLMGSESHGDSPFIFLTIERHRLKSRFNSILQFHFGDMRTLSCSNFQRIWCQLKRSSKEHNYYTF